MQTDMEVEKAASANTALSSGRPSQLLWGTRTINKRLRVMRFKKRILLMYEKSLAIYVGAFKRERAF